MTLKLASRAALVPVIALTLAGTGCSWLSHRETGYQNSREAPVLKIPQGLDEPSRTSALVIPSSANVAGVADPDAAPPVASLPGVAPGAVERPRYVGSETSLTLGDEVSSAYRRVALALERTGVMTVAAKDEQAGTITLKRDTVVREGGWFRKITFRTNTKTETVTRVVHVVAEGAGVRIQIEDAQGQTIEDESAREIIAAVKSRLG